MRIPVKFVVIAVVLGGLYDLLVVRAPASTKGETLVGFGGCIWHGTLVPFTFVISLFNPDVTIYELVNTGRSYNAGFVSGAWFSLGITFYIAVLFVTFEPPSRRIITGVLVVILIAASFAV